MIAPIHSFPIRGVVWYQGESNVTRSDQYRVMLPALIRGWRGAWGQGDFPFLVVQLANYELRVPEKPYESGVAELREAQMAALDLPRTAVIVTADLGEGNDVHPRGREGILFPQEVAGRLATAGLALAHDGKWENPFPRYQSMERVAGAIRLRFDTPGGELTLHKGAEGFAVAGADRRFVPAEARLEGETVVVSSPEVPQPVAVRYGWAANPKLSLFTESGLPAVPFRTDDWPGVTAGKDTVENDDPAL